MSAIERYFSAAGFIPHGYCLQWRPDVLGLHIVSDAIIAVAYFSIPLAIATFVRRRPDLDTEHRRVAALFGLFILGYGLIRFGLEFIREPDAHLVHFAQETGLHMGQWLSLPMILGGLYLVFTANKRAERVRPVPADEPAAT